MMARSGTAPKSTAATQLRREFIRPIFIGIVIDQSAFAKQQVNTLTLAVGAKFEHLVIHPKIGLFQPLTVGFQFGRLADDASHLVHSHARRDTVLEQPMEILAVMVLDIQRPPPGHFLLRDHRPTGQGLEKGGIQAGGFASQPSESEQQRPEAPDWSNRQQAASVQDGQRVSSENWARSREQIAAAEAMGMVAAVPNGRGFYPHGPCPVKMSWDSAPGTSPDQSHRGGG